MSKTNSRIYTVKSRLKVTAQFVLRFWYSSLKGSGMARVNEGSHMQFYLPPASLSTNGMSHPVFTSQPQNITALWPVFISRPTEGRKLSWPRWLVRYRGGMAARRRWPILLPAGDRAQFDCRKTRSTLFPKNCNNVEATLIDFVERIVRHVAFESVVSTWLLVWTGLYTLSSGRLPVYNRFIWTWNGLGIPAGGRAVGDNVRLWRIQRNLLSLVDKTRWAHVQWLTLQTSVVQHHSSSESRTGCFFLVRSRFIKF